MPRHGIGIDISTLAGSEGVVTTIDDFVFESFSAGQMHPILTTSRKQFARNNNDVVLTSNVTKDTSITVPPGQTGTAIRVIETTATGQHFATTVIDEVTAGDTYTMSLYVKSTYSEIKIYTNTSQISSNVTVNFTNETISPSSSTLRGGIEDAGGGWYRVNWTQVAQGSGSSLIYLVTKDLSSYTGSTSNFTDYFGMQVEQDGFASSFMLNTTSDVLTVTTTLNDTSEVWDFDGTDIMIAEDPEDEGFWEESYPDGASLPELVLNGDYEELGSELVSSGTFSSFSKDFGDVTISGDTASFVNTGSNANSRVSLDGSSIAANKRYKVVFDVSRHVVGIVQIVLQGTTHTVDITAGVDTYTVYLLAGSSGDTKFRFKRNGSIGDFDFDVDNISVKQVDPNDRWVLGTGWSISDGKAVATSCTNENLVGALSILIGNAYEVTFTVSDYSGSGTVKPMLGTVGAVSGTTVNADGTYTQILVADANQSAIAFRAGGTAFTGKIDNVSVKEYAIQPLDI